MSEETIKQIGNADKRQQPDTNVVTPLNGDDAERILPAIPSSTERENIQRERMRLEEEKKHHEEIGS